MIAILLCRQRPYLCREGNSATAKSALQRRSVAVHEDSELESAGSVNMMKEEALLRSLKDTKRGGSVIKTRRKAKPSKECLKTKAIYKTIIKGHERLSCKSNLTKKELKPQAVGNGHRFGQKALKRGSH